jgi:putative ABC transport system permease protein
MIGDLFRLAVRNVLHRRLRSWLTVIGILIGTAAVVALISIGQGLERSITQEVERIMGFNTLLITPQGRSFQARIELDLAALREIPGVEAAVAVRTETAYVEGPLRDGFLSLTGYDPAMEEFLGELHLELAVGEGLTAPGQVVLGARASQVLGAKVGDQISIEDRPFQVVGILAEQEEGGGMAYGGVPVNDSLYVLYQDLKGLFPGPDLAQLAFVKVSPEADVGQVKAEVERVLSRTGTTEAEVVGFEEITQRIRTVLGGVQAFLAGIAGISILVGGIGVMNTMYTAVLERTREIGVMKAVGAKDWQVMLMFLFESGLMGLAGGTLGLLVGLGVAKAASAVVQRLFQMEAGFSAVASAGLILGALAFSFGVGAISGLLPARRAAALPPVEALRYE